MKNLSTCSTATHGCAACKVAVNFAVFGTAAIGGTLSVFRRQWAIAKCHLLSGFQTSQTGELYGEWVLEEICRFSKSAVTSEISFRAAEEIGYCAA